MKSTFYLSLLLLVSIGCESLPDKKFHRVTLKKDYQPYLAANVFTSDGSRTEKYDSEIDFWEKKLEQEPNGFIYLEKLGKLWALRFEFTGNVEDLFISDSLFIKASPKVNTKRKLSHYHQIMRNAISRHDFNRAKEWGEESLKLETGKVGTLLMLFDAYLELAEYEEAQEIINSLRNASSFDYLVRLSRFMDHQGHLDSAIVLFEEAAQVLNRYNNKQLQSWAKCNLATMYGHGGQIEESYKLYLEVLKMDPEYYPALKGIAWIAYSHDRDTEEARKILSFILSRKDDPAIHLLLAKIAEYEGENGEKAKHIDVFYREATLPERHNLYNKSLVLVEAEEFENYSKAIDLSLEEIQNRPTPQSYDLLAWSYYNKSDFKKALKIAKSHVQGLSSEPEINYHLGMIYFENGNHHMAEKFLSMPMESNYELGPLISREIEQKLQLL